MTAQEWSDPGCFPVAPGVHRIPLSMPNDGLHAVNVYAIETATGLVLIDGGWRVASAVSELDDALGLIGRAAHEITDVFVTHVHRDHYTFAVELRRRHGSTVHLGTHERPSLEGIGKLNSNVPESSLRELGRSGAPELAAAVEHVAAGEPFEPGDWEMPDAWLTDQPINLGDRTLQVVPTPGHTKGHVVFHDLKNGLVFSGDHVLPTITPSIGFELGEWDLPLGHYLDSLDLLLERPDARLLPAHGDPTSSIHSRVSDLLEHHRLRLADTGEAVSAASGPVTALYVAERLGWTRRNRHFTELNDFNRMIATCETIAHLDLLVARGTLAVMSRDGVDQFRPAY